MSKSVSKRDYYEVLGVSRSASDTEIKSAYRRQAMKYHPDRNPGDAAAEESFKEASEAYAVLADSDKRSAYDRFGHAGVSSSAGGGFDPTVFTGFEDILGGLGDIFGFGDIFGGGRRRGGPPKRRFRFSGRKTATNATERARRQGRPRARVRSAAVRARSGFSRASSRSPAPARSAAARARSSRSPARHVTAQRASRRTARSRSRFQRASRAGSNSGCRVKANRDSPAARPDTSTSSSTCASTSSSGATA